MLPGIWGICSFHSAKFGIDLGEDSMWERWDGFSFGVPDSVFPWGFLGLGWIRFKVVPAPQYRFSKPLPGLLFPGEKKTKQNTKKWGKTREKWEIPIVEFCPGGEMFGNGGGGGDLGTNPGFIPAVGSPLEFGIL